MKRMNIHEATCVQGWVEYVATKKEQRAAAAIVNFILLSTN